MIFNNYTIFLIIQNKILMRFMHFILLVLVVIGKKNMFREEECEEVFKHMALGVALGTIPLVIIVSSGIIL